MGFRPQVPEQFNEVADKFVSGQPIDEDISSMRWSMSSGEWRELCQQRLKEQQHRHMDKCLAARGPDVPLNDKLDAIISLLAMGLS